MNKRVLTVKLLSSLLVMGGLAVTGCTDNDYDVNEIDTTIGIGGDGLELPASSTSDIQLKDVLELEANGVVVEDAETHNYVFRQAGNDVAAVHPYINTITLANKGSNNHKITLSLASAARGSRAAGNVLQGEGDIYTFEYDGSKPSEVLSLVSADATGSLVLSIKLQQIESVVQQIDKLTLAFPSYMKVEAVAPTSHAVGNLSVNGNVVTLQDVSTSENLVLGFDITGIDFTKADEMGKAAIVSTSIGDKVQIDGKVKLALSTTHYNLANASSHSLDLDNTLTMDDIVITGATGKFNPHISLYNLGSVHIVGVPDFLKDGNVVADLYNPVIKLDIQSDLGIEGKIGGQLIAVKDGRETARVTVPEFTVNPISVNEGSSSVYICRTAEGLQLPVGAEAVPVSNLSDLIKTIPDVIRFECDAHANTDKEGTFQLGHQYGIKPAYSIDAPLAFGEDAVIEYSDVFDGWNKDIEDYKLAKDAKVVLTANVVNGVPAYLTVEASAIDVSGNDIPASELEVKVEGEIAASTDGVTPVTSPLTITISQKDEEAFKKLDGIRFSVKGKAKGEDGTVVKGYTLNAQKHTLKLSDIKIKLTGKFIYDFN